MDRRELLRSKQMRAHPELAVWSEQRPRRSEGARSQFADDMAMHLPEVGEPIFMSDDDLNAAKAAFIRRFDEDLPRTETLMAVVNIGYRMALRDIKSKH